MAFKNLEQRYTERSKALYAAATLKFDGGKASRGANDDPLIVRKPGDGYFGVASRLLGRSLPVSSALQDVKRITLFTVSIRGLAFLAKQQLLQTGNTFEQTRLINPLFAIGAAAAPGLGNIIRIRRHLRPITGGSNSPGGGILSKTDTSYNNVRKLGQLQVGTYKDLTEKAGGNPVIGFLKKVAGPITSTISAFTAKKNVGEEFGGWDENSWKQSRPELGKSSEDYIISVMSNSSARYRFGGIVSPDNGTGALTFYKANTDGTYTTYLRLSDGIDKGPNVFEGFYSDYGKLKTDIEGTVSSARLSKLSDIAQQGLQKTPSDTDNFLSGSAAKYVTKWNKEFNRDGNNQIKFLEYFTPGDGAAVNQNGSANVGKQIEALRSTDTVNGQFKKISYIKDPLNLPSDTPIKRLSVNTPSIYDNLPTTGSVKNDIINVSFAMSSDAPVQFRAFVSNINESSTPQYKEYQYIGRVERFISYVSVKRQVSFKLVVVAYSEGELETVWAKINYLTSLTYPYNVYKGILQPNIVKLSLGNIYRDQPGYVTSIRSDFGGNISSWDIDKQVPHGATVDINFDIIEKKGVTTAGSELYGLRRAQAVSLPTINVT